MSTPPLDSRGLPPGTVLRDDLEISPRDVHALITAADPARPVLLIDCRTQDEWDTAHIPGSVLMPLDQLERRTDELDIQGASTCAVICHHGRRSLKAALLLRALGHKNVLSVAGGIDLWSRAVDPSIPRYDKSSGRCVIIR